jgi:hypothetical protein
MENLITASKRLNNLCFICCIFSFISSCYAQGNKVNTYAEIRFEDRFSNDTINFYLNGEALLISTLLNSDKSDGLTNIQINIYREGDVFYAVTSINKVRKKFLKLNESFKMEVVLNGKNNSFETTIEKGKFIGFSNDGKGLILFNQSYVQPKYD